MQSWLVNMCKPIKIKRGSLKRKMVHHIGFFFFFFSIYNLIITKGKMGFETKISLLKILRNLN